MAVPTLVTYTETVWTSSGSKNTAAQISWQSGDLIVVIGATETGASPAAPTCTGLVFGAITGCAVTSGTNCWGNAWSATAGSSGGPQYVAGTGNGSNRWGFAVWVWRAHTGTGGAIGTASATTPHTLLTAQITKAAANSCVCGALFDYSAAVTTNYAWTPTIGNSRQANRNNPYWTYYVGDWGDQGAAGAASYGISGVGSSGPFTKFAVEIKGLTDAHAGQVTTTGTAPAPAVSVAVAASPAAGTGTAPEPLAQAGHPAPLAPATATAPTAGVTVTLPSTASVDTVYVTVYYTPPEGAAGQGNAGNAPATATAPAPAAFAEQPVSAPLPPAAGTAPDAQASTAAAAAPGAPLPPAAGTAPAPAVVTQPGGLNANTGFELALDPWYANGTSTVLARDSTWAAAGTWSAQVSVTASQSYPGMRSEAVTVTPGGTYTAAAQIRSASGATVQAGILWYTAGDAYISSDYDEQALGAGQDQPFTVTAEAPGTAAHAVLFAQATGTVTPGTTFNADNFTINPGTPFRDAPAGLPAAAAAAPAATPAAAPAAGQPAATGTAPTPVVSAAVPAPLPPAAGTAPFDTTANSSSLDLIADSPVYGHGYAYTATVSKVPAGTGNAPAPPATGTAPTPAAGITVPAGNTPATGTAPPAAPAAGPAPAPATATGTAPAPVPAGELPAPAATSTGTAPDVTVTTITAGTAYPGPAAGTAPAPTAGAGIPAGPAPAAAASGTATPDAAIPAPPAPGTGTAYQPGRWAGLAAATGTAYDVHRQLYDTGWLYPTSAAIITGPWANLSGAEGDTIGDPATWTSQAHTVTGTLEASGYDAQPAVQGGAVIGDLTIIVRHAEDTPAEVAAATAQAYTGTSPYGSPQALTISADEHEDEVTVTGLTFDDLADLRIQVSITRT